MSAGSTAPGGGVTATLNVTASKAQAQGTVVHLWAPGATASPDSQGLGTLNGSRSAVAYVRVPATAKAGTIQLVATATASGASAVTATRTISVTGAPNTTPPPSGGGGATLPSGTPSLPPGMTPPTGNGPQVALPPIAPPQVAPDMQAAAAPLRKVGLRSNATLESNRDDLTAVQAGWLAALLTVGWLTVIRLRLARRDDHQGRRAGRLQAAPAGADPRVAAAGRRAAAQSSAAPQRPSRAARRKAPTGRHATPPAPTRKRR